MSSRDDISLSQCFKTILNKELVDETQIYLEMVLKQLLESLVSQPQPRYCVCAVTIPIWRQEL